MRFITYVAIGGVAVGVAALLLALSIVRGFSEEIQSKITGVGAHVQIESLQDAAIGNVDELRERVEVWPEVLRVSPVVQEFTLLRRSAAEIDGVMLWGIDAQPPFLEESLIRGGTDVGRSASGHWRIVIGADLARLLGVDVGEVVTAMSVGTDAARGAQTGVQIVQFEIGGIYETFLQNFDELFVLADINVVRELAGLSPNQATRIDVTLESLDAADEIARRIDVEMGFPLIARTVYEVHRGLFAWIDLQENIIPPIIGVIIIVAAFNIISTLLMLILEKTREIGVLGSLGASGRTLRRLFLLLGLLIGTIGTSIGAAIAIIAAFLQSRYELIPLPAEAYYLDRAPISLHGGDFLLVGAVALGLCLLSAYIPARIAARIDPVRAIRLQ